MKTPSIRPDGVAPLSRNGGWLPVFEKSRSIANSASSLRRLQLNRKLNRSSLSEPTPTVAL
jgi:hypothetical protein